MKEIYKNSIDLIKRKKGFMLIPLALLIIAYGFYATHYSFHIDQNVPGYFIGKVSITQGRWAKTLINVITNLLYYRPFFNTALFILIFYIAALCWAALFKKATNNQISDKSIIVFMSFYVVSPFIAELMTYFLLNDAFSHLLIPIILYYFFEFCEKKKLRYFITATLLFLVVVDIYETFAALLFFGFMAYIILRYIYVDNKDKKLIRKYFLMLLKLILIVILAIGLDILISKGICYLVTGSTKYWYSANTSITWTNGKPLTDNIKTLFKSFILYYLVGGVSNYHVFLLQLFTVVGLILSIVFAVKKKTFLPVFLYICSLIALFSIDIVLGKCIGLRIEQGCAVFIAFVVMLLIQYTLNKKALCIAISVILTFLCLGQTIAIYERSLFNYERFEYENELLIEVGEDLVQYPIDEKPVAFTYSKGANLLPKAFSVIKKSSNPIIWRYQNLMCKIYDKVLPDTILKKPNPYKTKLHPYKSKTWNYAVDSIDRFPLHKSYIQHQCYYSQTRFRAEIYNWYERLGYTLKPCSAKQHETALDMRVDNDYNKRYLITETDDMVVVQFMEPKY